VRDLFGYLLHEKLKEDGHDIANAMNPLITKIGEGLNDAKDSALLEAQYLAASSRKAFEGGIPGLTGMGGSVITVVVIGVAAFVAFEFVRAMR